MQVIKDYLTIIIHKSKTTQHNALCWFVKPDLDMQNENVS